MDQAFGKARIGEPAFGFQNAEQRVDVVVFFDERSELAGEFSAAVFATRQIAERAPF